MSIYVMSDIHGCYDAFRSMLKKINFSDQDTLILAGDYIDRGLQNYEMMQYISNHPDNVIFLCGNHDREYLKNIELMQQVMQERSKGIDINKTEHVKALYDVCRDIFTEDGECFFDYYGTIEQLITEHNVTFRQLAIWAIKISEMPYYYKLKKGNQTCIIVHAGFIENIQELDSELNFDSEEEFYLYAREESIKFGGIQNGMIISGHTPTIAKEEFAYNHGEVFCVIDEEKDCVFYDIDCGVAYKAVNEEAHLACLCLDDEKVYYL